MQLGTKRKMRHFKLKVSLSGDPFDRWAQEVIDGIENDELCVYHPDDKKALDLEMTAEGDIILEGRATLPVSIREWLPVGCQLIRWQLFSTKETLETLGMYRNNGSEVLWPKFGEYRPAGPAAFAGIVGLNVSVVREQAPFKCLLAHELVHVFDTMRFVVPAFMNWDAFWSNVLDHGSRCETLWKAFDMREAFVDSYGAIQEVTELRRYWPKNADGWFDALSNKCSLEKS